MPDRDLARFRSSLCLGLIIASLSASANGSEDADELPSVGAQAPWRVELRNDDPKAGYVLYKRRLPGSESATYRLEGVIDAPPHRVAQAARDGLLDPEETQARMRKEIVRDDGDVVVVYSYIDLPLVRDRDVLTRAERSFDPATQSYRLSWSATDEGPPPKAGVIRVGRSDGSWHFEPLPGGRTCVTYTSHTEIPGSIPGWLVNSIMDATLVEGFEGLRTRVAAERRGEGG